MRSLKIALRKMHTHQRLFERWRRQVRRLKTNISALSLAYAHPRTPWYAKLVAVSVAAYAFSPIDLIPDFIPVLGYLDDLVLVPAGIVLALRLIPPDVLAECRQAAEAAQPQHTPVRWLAAATIAVIWIVVAAVAISVV